MSDLGTDAIFRARLIRLVGPELCPIARVAIGFEHDAVGQKLDRYRYGATLKMAAALVQTSAI